jgi:hypothetical protein
MASPPTVDQIGSMNHFWDVPEMTHPYALGVIGIYDDLESDQYHFFHRFTPMLDVRSPDFEYDPESGDTEY